MEPVALVARRQHGLFTWRQAFVAGLSEQQLRTRLQRGEVLRVRRGVFVVAGAPPSYAQSVLAALLATEREAWASHRTAAKLFQLQVPEPAGIDVLTGGSARMRLEGVEHHRSNQLRDRDVASCDGVPVTSVARTLIDCAPFLRGRALAAAFDDARRRKLTTYPELDDAHRFIDRGRRTGRHLVRPVRPVVLDRNPGGSQRELDVLGALAAYGVPLPEQQVRVDLPSGPRFLDYGYPLLKLGLEFDGYEEHGLIRSTFDDDRDRDAELLLAGWWILHFTSRTTAKVLADRVLRAIDLRAAA
jgi:hypothetical protein